MNIYFNLIKIKMNTEEDVELLYNPTDILDFYHDFQYKFLFKYITLSSFQNFIIDIIEGNKITFCKITPEWFKEEESFFVDLTHEYLNRFLKRYKKNISRDLVEEFCYFYS